jgi:hypothetical protein
VQTIVRGKVVAKDGEIVATSHDGEFIRPAA